MAAIGLERSAGGRPCGKLGATSESFEIAVSRPRVVLSKDEAVRLTPPIRMTLEKSLAWIQDDELMEVTPKSIRLRKTHLDPNDRKRFERSKEAVTGHAQAERTKGRSNHRPAFFR